MKIGVFELFPAAVYSMALALACPGWACIFSSVPPCLCEVKKNEKDT